MITIKEKFCTTINYGDLTDLFPRELGWEQCVPKQSWGPYARPYYMIHYVAKGKGTFTCPRGTYNVSAGQIFVIKSYESTLYKPDPKDPWAYIWIGLSGKLAKPLKKVPDIIDFASPELFEALLQYPTLKQMKTEFLIGYFSLILASVCRNHIKEDEFKTNFVKTTSELIKLNYMNELSAESLAVTAGITRRYLSTLFKAELGMTLKEYIIDVRMKHACEFLKIGYNVSETAKKCGYTDTFNFSKMFKKYIGISPFEYKQKGK